MGPLNVSQREAFFRGDLDLREFITLQNITNANTPTEKMMGRCIQGYSNREGFFGKIGGLAYRIWNMVKAIFGQSDWQRTRRALCKEMTDGIPAMLKNNKEIRSLMNTIADATLVFGVEALNAKTFEEQRVALEKVESVGQNITKKVEASASQALLSAVLA